MVVPVLLMLVACDQPDSSGIPDVMETGEEGHSELNGRSDSPERLELSPRPQSGVAQEGPEGRLPDEATLAADTVAAARYSALGSEGSPVGAWAGTSAECGLIDQADAEPQFLIVTPSSIRDAHSRCTVSLGAIEEAAPFAAICFAQGQSQEREIVLDLQDPQRLRFRSNPGEGEVDLVRCNL